MAAEDRSDLPPLSAYGAEWDGFTIPDDAAELAAEADAVRAELRDTGEHGQVRAWLRGRVLSRNPAARFRSADRSSTYILVAAIAIVAAMFAIAPVLAPTRHVPNVTALPLADAHVAAGLPGGLMPDVQVSIRGEQHSIRELRPAVFLFLPVSCDCEAAVRNVITASSARMAQVYLLSAPSPADTKGSANVAPTTSGNAQSQLLAEHLSYAQAIEDPDPVLWQLFGDDDAGALFISANGLILSNPIAISTLTRIEPWLDRLSH